MQDTCKTPQEMLSAMPLRQKAAQTLVPAYFSHEEGCEAVKNGVGGVWAIYHFKNNSTCLEFADEVKKLQESSDIPLFICADMETGAGQMIHDGKCAEFPEPMSYSAIADINAAEHLAYKQGQAMASEAMALGWNVALTPVVDVNTSAYNPSTNVRSCGDDVERVTRVMNAMIRGMQSCKIIATAKHFPGQGMQLLDSHFGLENVKLTQEEMQLHLKPFADAVSNGVRCIMTNHAIYEVYDPENVSTFSKAIMTDILRGKLGFKNLLMTDAMEMQGVSEQSNGADAVIRALIAGNDLILGPVGNISAIIDAIVAAVEDGALPIERLDEACLRILEGKAWQGMFSGDVPSFDMPDGSNWALAQDIAQKTVTIIRDAKNYLPLNRDSKVLVIEPVHPKKELDFGLYTNTTMIFDHIKDGFDNAEFELFEGGIGSEKMAQLADKAKKFDFVIVSTSFRSRAGQVGLLTKEQVSALKQISDVNPNIVAVIANPYASSQIPFIGTVICGYSTSKVAVQAIVAVINGKRAGEGVLSIKLPETLDASFEIKSHD